MILATVRAERRTGTLLAFGADAGSKAELRRRRIAKCDMLSHMLPVWWLVTRWVRDAMRPDGSRMNTAAIKDGGGW